MVDAQLGTLDHRGPDARGSFAAERAVIGQNRLAIIDLVTGDPPITNEDGTVAVVLNGEIYNFRELRAELKRGGHALPLARRHRGDRPPRRGARRRSSSRRRLDGMFAFAVWDERRRRLVLGRDRRRQEAAVLLAVRRAARVRAARSRRCSPTPPCRGASTPHAIPAYLTFGYVPTPRTFFEGIRSVPPGHVLTLEPGGEPRIERYWEPPLAGTNGDATARAVTARRRRARCAGGSRRPCAGASSPTCRSAPSSAAASTRAPSSGSWPASWTGPVQTFTIGFEDRDGFDERPYAAARGRAPPHRPPRVRGPSGRRRSRRAARLAPRPAIRRLERDPDLSPQRDDATPRDGRAVRRRRRRAVRRLRALRRRAGGPPLRGRCPAARAARRERGARTCSRATRSAAGPARSSASPASPSAACRTRTARWISFVQDPERDALLDGRRDDWALEDYRAIWRGSRGRAPARPPARPQPAHLPARRPAREGRPNEHGPRARGPLTVPRRGAARVRHAAAAAAQGPRASRSSAC